MSNKPAETTTPQGSNNPVFCKDCVHLHDAGRDGFQCANTKARIVNLAYGYQKPSCETARRLYSECGIEGLLFVPRIKSPIKSQEMSDWATKKLFTESVTTPAPRIGAYWPDQGGIYAGIMRGHDGEADYYLIVGPAFEAAAWDKQKSAAAALTIDGHKDFTLPKRNEQSLQFANVPELFERECYWSGTQHAADSSFAWYQCFNYGGQYYHTKSAELRARAVRRLIIQ